MNRTWIALTLAALLAAACSSGDDGGGGPAADVRADAAGPGADVAPGADVPDDDDAGTPPPDGAGPGPDAGGDDVAAPDDASAPALPPEEWCQRWSETYCALLARCPLPGLETRSEAGCRAAVGTGCAADELAAAVAAGRLGWDGAAARSCLEATTALDCQTFSERLRTSPTPPAPTCAEVLEGRVAPGGDCFLGTECQDGSFCTFGPACPGTCAAFAALDAACGADAWCDFATAACVDGTCRPLPDAEGAPCAAGRCRAPRLCDPATDTCRTPSVAASPCGGGRGVCLAGLLCFGEATGGGTCQPLRADGETCFGNDDCRAPLVCVGGTCGAAPGTGEACFDFLCAGAWCETTAVPPTCRAWPATGTACAPGSRCAPADACDAGTCRARRSAGEPCTTPQQCAEGRCYGGECRARAEAACPTL